VEAAPSRTAIQAAVARGTHRLRDERPWILDDPFALILVGPTWSETHERLESLFSERLLRRARSGIALRSRFAEDRLSGGIARQYVMLGAGLDLFAWRRPDLLVSVRVFEIDHPASQAWKRERATALGLPTSDDHAFVALDFETTSLRDGLDMAGFDWDQPTTFSWLGVTAYLTVDAIEETLQTVAACRPGTDVVFTYAPSEDCLDDDDRETLAILAPMTASSSEPLQTFFSAHEVDALVDRCGLRVDDHPDPDEVMRRYFADRTDGLSLWGVARLVVATVC
jgi:methyltransferase (TIGR00027 family)